MKKIVVVAGSNNSNLLLADKFKNNVEDKGHEAQILDLVKINLPMYTTDQENIEIPNSIHEHIKIMDTADRVVFVTPEYNGGVPPILTNFFAWISRSGDSNWRKCFDGKKAALATHGGSCGIRVLAALRMQLSYLGMILIGRDIVTTKDKKLDDSSLEDVVTQLLQ